MGCSPAARPLLAPKGPARPRPRQGRSRRHAPSAPNSLAKKGSRAWGAAAGRGAASGRGGLARSPGAPIGPREGRGDQSWTKPEPQRHAWRPQLAGDNEQRSRSFRAAPFGFLHPRFSGSLGEVRRVGRSCKLRTRPWGAGQALRGSIPWRPDQLVKVGQAVDPGAKLRPPCGEGGGCSGPPFGRLGRNWNFAVRNTSLSKGVY